MSEATGNPFDRAFAAVFFDNDGTLVDSQPAAERAWLAWAAEYDVPLTSLAGMHGVTAAEIIARIAPHLDAEEALGRIVALETDDDEGVEALPGAREALNTLGDRAAVVTSATADLARKRLAAAGLREPDVLVTAEDVVRGKPDPEPFLLAASRMRVDAADCLVVEDAPSGLAAARAAGCATLAVVTTNPPGALAAADLVVTDLGAVRFHLADPALASTPITLTWQS